MNTINVNDITHKIIGCAMQVHNTLGNGFQEVIYQRALEIEMRIAGLEFVREMEMPIFYREELIGTRRPVHKAQAINYCEAFNIADGLLINFGGLSLEFKRVYNKKLVTPK